MPIYEYRCDNCGFQKEYLQRMSDPQLTDCPECKKATLSKMVTAAGFQLKGGGWYVTDFKGAGSKAGGSKKPEEKQTDTSAKVESPAAGSGNSEKPKAEAAASSTGAPAASGTR
jgi:putative FmdB family regulatory protein